jgi:hypothetical protein
MTTFPRLIRHLTLAAALSLLCSAAALAANTGLVADAKARYRQDMADCNSGKSHQDLASCRLEARNALAEASRGGLNDIGDPYLQNALKRCGAYQGDDRNDCETRMSSDSNIEGSVGSGGILRKSITIVPAN